jgi:hypothetical protein
MTIAAYQDLQCEQGAAFTRTLQLKRGGVAMPLTGYKARMQVRPSISNAAITVELNTENGRISIDAVNGVVTLRLTATETGNLKVPSDRAGFPHSSKQVYDLFLIPADGSAFPIMRGGFEIVARVTR